MTDIFTQEKRSWIMSRIRGKNTKIELQMKKIISDLPCSFKIHPKMFGNPDFVIKHKMIIIFCDGDFWHGYKYNDKKKPAKKFWKEKIENNMRRDKRVSRYLRANGWSVLRFWEHDIEKKPEFCKRKIMRKLSR